MSKFSSASWASPSEKNRKILLLLGIIFITLNLRAAITGIGPLLPDIQSDLSLSAGMAGLLTSLPLFCFAFISPYAATLARKTGIELALFIALLVLVSGLFIRYLPSVSLLYGGTILIGISIAVCNVLVPGLIRREFPERMAFVMAIFTMVLVSFGGLGSALAIPLQQLGHWRFSMLAWIIPAIVAVLLWSSQLKNNNKTQQSKASTSPSIWRSGLAWQVSIFMGCQSSAFYVLIAWLPSILADQGINAASSGWILFIYQCFVLLSVMSIPFFIKHFYDQRLIGVLCGSLNLLAYLGLLIFPTHVMTWMIIMGLGCGGSLALAMTLFGLRTSSVSQTVSLSGMAQSVGYLVAAIMPIIIGILYDWNQNWNLALLIMVLLCAIQTISGYLCGRPLLIGE